MHQNSTGLKGLLRTRLTNFTPWVILWSFFEKQINVQCGIGSISMLIFPPIHNATNRAIAKNSWQRYFEEFAVLFSRKQQGAMRTDWKIYSCIFYHLCIMVTIFQMPTSLFSTFFDIFNNNTFFGTIQKADEKELYIYLC